MVTYLFLFRDDNAILKVTDDYVTRKSNYWLMLSSRDVVQMR